MTLPLVRECTLYTADETTIRLVATAGAALGLKIKHETTVPTQFPECGLLLISTDLAPLSIPIRDEVFLLDLGIEASGSVGALIGMAGDEGEVIANLVGRLAYLLTDGPKPRVISLAAASGGLGLTTMIALLGLSSVRSNRSTLVIENSSQLLRILGASGSFIDHELLVPAPKRVGVLAPGVVVTSALLVEAAARFDSVIFGVGVGGDPTIVSPPYSLYLTANTAISVEQSAASLTGIRIKANQVLVREMSYGALTANQVSVSLRIQGLRSWPDDPHLSRAADFGDLSKASRSMALAMDLWTGISGGHIDR